MAARPGRRIALRGGGGNGGDMTHSVRYAALRGGGEHSSVHSAVHCGAVPCNVLYCTVLHCVVNTRA